MKKERRDQREGRKKKKEGRRYNILYFVLWLNNNEIICNVGLGCESESIDQGRSYIEKNINISNCFFSSFSTNI